MAFYNNASDFRLPIPGTLNDQGAEQTGTVVIPSSGQCLLQLNGGPGMYTLSANLDN